MSLRTMLKILGSRIMGKDDVHVYIMVAHEVVVEVLRSDLCSWCERRIESRKGHVGRGYKYWGGGSTFSGKF